MTAHLADAAINSSDTQKLENTAQRSNVDQQRSILLSKPALESQESCSARKALSPSGSSSLVLSS